MYFLFFLLVLGLANVVVYYAGRHDIILTLFSSDALYLPTLFSNLLSKNGNIADWFLTPAPYFFPDYPIFLFAYLLTYLVAGVEPYYQIVIFSLIQIAFTFMAIWFLAKQLLDSNAFFTTITISILLIWLALAPSQPFYFPLISAFHYGVFLTSIIFISLWLRCEKQKTNKSKVILHLSIAILAFFSTLSDDLFIVQVAVPLCVTAILFAIVEKDFSLRSKFPLALMMVFSILGSVCYKFIVINPTSYPTVLGLEKIGANIEAVYTIFNTVIINNLVFGAFFLFYLGVVAYTLFQLFSCAKNSTMQSFLVVFSFLSFCTTVVTIILVTNIPVTDRYLIPSFFWPIIVVFIFLNNFLDKKIFTVSMIFSSLLIINLSWNSYEIIKNKGFNFHYYPKEIACIDDALQKATVTNGIAMYWDAKHIQNFSKLDLNIAQHTSELREDYWITSKKYFRKSYDFAILPAESDSQYKKFSEALIYINGNPDVIKNCGNRSVYIYGKDKLRIKEIINIGDAFTWKAFELPTVIGEKTAEYAMRKKDINQSGYVTFGPYNSLPTGHYVFEIEYLSTASKANTIGNWDVVLALPKEAKNVIKGRLTGTGGVAEKITGKFALDTTQNMEKIEIRTQAKEGVDLTVFYIRVERVQ